MNENIKTNIEQGIQYLKVGIIDALSSLESKKEKTIRFETPLPLQLIIWCAEERGWEDNMDDEFDM